MTGRKDELRITEADIPKLEIVSEVALGDQMLALLRKHGELSSNQLAIALKRSRNTTAPALMNLESAGTLTSRLVNARIGNKVRRVRLYKLVKR